jgi:hypothetical protein
MSSINFQNGTIIPASWLNDVNRLVYEGNGPGGVPGADIIQYNEGNAKAVTRSVASRLRDVVSVKDFGAKGDAVFDSGSNTWSGTDDTAAFQAALDAGVAIFIPQGNYRITSELTTSTAMVMTGEGSDLSVLITSCVGWTLRGNFTIDLEGFAIQGHTNNQSAATAFGWDSYNAASHNWRLRDIRFQYLNRVMWFSQSWIGHARDVYVNDCGGAVDWAIAITNATNSVTFDNLQIRGDMGGVGTGPTGLWQGKGVITSSDCYDTNFINLGMEHLSDEAAKFGNIVTIHGAYCENELYPTEVNQVTFNNNGVVVGGVFNCIVKSDSQSNPTFIGTQFLESQYPSFNIIGSEQYYRNALDLTSSGPRLPTIQGTSIYTARLGSVSNFQNSSVVPGTIDDYNGGSHTLALVSDGYFNTKSLSFTVTSAVGYGGAIGLPYALKPSTRTDVYAWAIVKCSTTDQVVLSLGGPNSETPGNTYFSPLTPNHWYLVTMCNVNPYDSYLWLRLYGNAGGPASIGAVLTVDSWGVSFGGLDFSGIYA